MQNIRFLCMLGVIVLSLTSITIAAQESPALHKLQLLDCSGLPCVDATLQSGKKIRLLIDTGNVNSVVDSTVAKEAGLAVDPILGRDGKPLAGFGSSVLTSLKLGDSGFGDLKVVVMDLAADIKRDRMPVSDGTIAYTAFKDRLLVIDYKKQQLSFSEKLSVEIPCTNSCGTMTTPTFGKKGPPILVTTGFEVNGRPISVQIDTLFTGTMLIYPTAIEKLALSDVAKSDRKQFFKFTDDGVEMIEGIAKTESFGGKILAENAPLYFATPAVHLPDGMFDGTVGHALFKSSVIWLDFHDMKMRIEK
jgi:hypothetical protein